MEKGAEYIHWDEKRKAYQNQTGDIRRGVGMALFSYKTGVWPISLEIAGARLSLNQDGSVQLQVGATEIGQGADTVFSQMAAETLTYGYFQGTYCNPAGYRCDAFLIQVRMLPDSPLSQVQL